MVENRRRDRGRLLPFSLITFNNGGGDRSRGWGKVDFAANIRTSSVVARLDGGATTFSKNLEIFERLPRWCLAVIWEKSRDSRGIRERIRGSRHEALTRRVTRELNTGLATLSLSAQEGKGKVAISESSGRVFNMLIVYLR